MLTKIPKTRRRFSVGTREEQPIGFQLPVNAPATNREEALALPLREGSSAGSGSHPSPEEEEEEDQAPARSADLPREQLRSLSPVWLRPLTEFQAERGGSANQPHLLPIWARSVGTLTHTHTCV